MTTKAQANRERIAENKRAAWFKRVRTLTGHLVSKRMDVARAENEYNSGTSAESYAALLASKEPVGAALHPMKSDAVAEAIKQAQNTVRRVQADLEANGWDVEKCAPYPSSSSRRDRYVSELAKYRYVSELAKYQLYHSLTTEDKNDERNRLRRHKQPHYVVMSEKGIARFIEESTKDAAFEYDMFICKMVGKVGDCISASIEGNHVWAHSILTVIKLKTGEERWKTKQIWNVSKLGKDFPQWPSRLMK